MNRLFPVFLKLEELRLLIVGGGAVALEKLEGVLRNAPATNILLVAPEVREEILQLAAKHTNLRIIMAPFEMAFLRERDLVISAVNDPALSAEIRHLCKAEGKLVNVADRPALCDFYLGSIVQRGDLKIAISTNGQSPSFAVRLKEVLNDALPEDLDEIIESLQSLRNTLKGDLHSRSAKLRELLKNF